MKSECEAYLSDSVLELIYNLSGFESLRVQAFKKISLITKLKISNTEKICMKFLNKMKNPSPFSNVPLK